MKTTNDTVRALSADELPVVDADELRKFYVTASDVAFVTKGYAIVLQYRNDRDKDDEGWSVSFRTHPTFGIEATGRPPTIDEIVTVLSSLPGSPIWMIPVVQAANAQAMEGK